MLKKIIIISILSISLFANSRNDAYVPLEPTGNEIQLYPNYSQQIQDNLENQRKYNNSEPTEIVINNEEDVSIVDHDKNITQVEKTIEEKNYDLYHNGIKSNDKNIIHKENKDILNIETNDNNYIDDKETKVPLGVQEIIIQNYEEEEQINIENINNNEESTQEEL